MKYLGISYIAIIIIIYIYERESERKRERDIHGAFLQHHQLTNQSISIVYLSSFLYIVVVYYIDDTPDTHNVYAPYTFTVSSIVVTSSSERERGSEKKSKKSQFL